MKDNPNSHTGLELEFLKKLRERVLLSYKANMNEKGKNAHIETPDNKNSHYYNSLENDIEAQLSESGETISYATLHRFFWKDKAIFRSYTIELLEKYADLNKTPPGQVSISDRTVQEVSVGTYIVRERTLSEYLLTLKFLYHTTYQIEEGCEIAAEALKIFTENIGILRYWILFHNRARDWENVRIKLQEISKNYIANKNILAECYLGLYESHLNEFIRENWHGLAAFDKLKKAKLYFLDNIPGKETIGKYYFFLARYYEAEWCILPNEIAKVQNMLLLIDKAEGYIYRALEDYPKEDEPGYREVNPIPFWLYCHKAMLHKIRKNKNYNESLSEFSKIINDKLEGDENTLVKSFQSNVATLYLLAANGNYNVFESLLDKFAKQINQRIKELKLPSKKEESEVNTYPGYHIRLLFWRDKDQAAIEIYQSIFDEFQNKCLR
ncbi:MAG: hypothetical protein JWP81_1540 [Ferruginibacter sp.]|nr:hypothetical protein [Ferruginibacter sp.]